MGSGGSCQFLRANQVGRVGQGPASLQETQGMLAINTSLQLEMVAYQGANLRCDISTGALSLWFQRPSERQSSDMSMDWPMPVGRPHST